MGEPIARFRSRMIPCFLFYTVFSQLGYLAIVGPVVLALTFLRPNFPEPWLLLVAGCGGCGILSLLITPVAVWLYPVYVSPTHLKAYNFWGIYTTVTWDEITAAWPLNLGIVGMVRVPTTRTMLPFWIPQFLEDMDQFAELVRESAGPDHPLTAALAGSVDDD